MSVWQGGRFWGLNIEVEGEFWLDFGNKKFELLKKNNCLLQIRIDNNQFIFVVISKVFEYTVMIYTIIVMLFKPQKEVYYDSLNEARI